VRYAQKLLNLQAPFNVPVDLTEFYSITYKVDTKEPQLRHELEKAITHKGAPTSSSIRSLMGQVMERDLKELKRSKDDLPLAPVVPGRFVDVEFFKALGRSSMLDGPAFDLLFELLTMLRNDFVNCGRATTGASVVFDGYFTLDLVVWALLQVALDKKMVCIYIRWSYVR
jgi:hypothetical protein